MFEMKLTPVELCSLYKTLGQGAFSKLSEGDSVWLTWPVRRSRIELLEKATSASMVVLQGNLELLRNAR